MQSRFLKQLIYGSLYLIILLGLGYLLYAPFKAPASCFDNRKNQGETEIDCGGPCESCELRRLKPIQVSPVSLFSIDGRTVSALFELVNPNTKYGAERFSHKIEFFDSGGRIIDSVTKESFIYPGEIKYIVEPSIEVSGPVARAAAEVSGFVWKPIAEFSAPKTQTRDIKIEIKEGAGEARIAGLLINQNSFRISRAVIIAVIHDQSGNRTGFSKTLVLDMEPFEERSFAITIPITDSTGLSRDSVKIFVEARR